MLEYNTQKEKLVLPEFGRNIQQMVDYCMTIADRDERNRCAQAIVAVMSNLFSHQRDIEDFDKMIWNQLAIMSDFKLDIDYPCEVIRPENLYSKPERIPYQLSPIRLRHYGKIVEQMIDIAVGMPEGEERDYLCFLIANQMKKQLTQVNADAADDYRVLSDLEFYSHGQIHLDPEQWQLWDYREPSKQQNNGKAAGKNTKKKKRK